MTKTLDVYLHTDFVGNLIQNEHGDMVFTYAESWLGHPQALPLSQSLPLKKEPFSRNECRGFFAGILPEESKRELVARNLGISARNDFAMIEQIGGECAGAVTFIPAGEKLPTADYQYRALSEDDLAHILKELPRRPLMAGEDGIRLSLAGAQDKIAVHVAGDQISVPLGGAPSTHILKPAIAHFEGVVFNEATCMKLAAAIGLPVAPVEIRSAGEIDFLLVERYDRKDFLLPLGMGLSSPTLYLGKQRMHQEDFCQALGIVSENKYQREGGPSLKNGFELLRDVSTTPVIDLQRFLDAAIFNFLVGNHDAHGKNFSLTYDQAGILNQTSIRLAPLYDIVCTTFYSELSKKMAMKIGGEYESTKIHPRHFEKMAEECGLAKPLVKKRVPELAAAVIAALDTITIPHPVADGVRALIREHSQRTIELFRD